MPPNLSRQNKKHSSECYFCGGSGGIRSSHRLRNSGASVFTRIAERQPRTSGLCAPCAHQVFAKTLANPPDKDNETLLNSRVSGVGGHFLAPTEHPKIACVIYTLYILSCFFICEFLQKCTFLFKNLAYNSKPSYKQNYLIIGNNWLFSYFVLVYGYALIK
jgi:hypothetical protein